MAGKIPSDGDLRLWWMPQVSADAPVFYVPVDDLKEAARISAILTEYDRYLFEHERSIKGNYASASGLEIYAGDSWGVAIQSGEVSW